MPKTLSVAVAGAGLMGLWHVRYARACGASICGVVDPNSEAADRLARANGARGFQDLNELIAKSKPEVIHVCTPASSHAAIAEIAMKSGAHVLIEKPLAATSAASKDLLNYARQKGLMLVPVHQFLFQRGVRRAQDVLPALGRIFHVDAVFYSAGGERTDRGLDEVAEEIVPHPLSLIERFLPGSLRMFEWSVERESEGEWRIAGHGGGVTASIVISLHVRPTEASLRIAAEHGVIDLDLFHGFGTIDRSDASRGAKIMRPFRRSANQFMAAAANLAGRSLRRESAYPGLRELIAEFYAAIRNGAAPPIGSEEILSVEEARDALHSMVHARQRGAI